MSIKTSRVFAAWAQLTPAERTEVIGLINKYQEAKTQTEKEGIAVEHINESKRSFIVKSTTMNFGPVPGTCPTCGR
jgi:hypothetical protein